MSDQSETLGRLRTAQIAIAALMVHDSLPYQKVFRLLESDVARLSDPSGEGVMARAAALVGAPQAGAPEPEKPQIERRYAVPPGDQRHLMSPETPLTPGALYTPAEAALLIGCDQKKLQNDADRGRIGKPPHIPPTMLPGKNFGSRHPRVRRYTAEAIELGRMLHNPAGGWFSGSKRVGVPAGELLSKTKAARDAAASMETLTATQAAQLLGVRADDLRQHAELTAKRGGKPIVPFVTAGRQMMFRRADLLTAATNPSGPLKALREKAKLNGGQHAPS